MSISFTLNYTRPGVSNHPIESCRDDNEETTDVVFNDINMGVFQSHTSISMFEGELTIHILTSTGHFLNFVIVIVQPDEMPVIIKSDEYSRDTNKDTLIKAILGHFEDAMWMSAKFRRNLRYWFDGELDKIGGKIEQAT